ncbi:hypothetical protein KIN20_025193 [Parelaphostrongylus tenuis]|uniref:Uncharacterized protein n=1 Tax=Parelaphostrongylus tenuis TaxID=148309 RepID=A0AAD5QXQ9_PARTN|nr:hypothetical protein KIN20_025193 [Parelaphostrongylus tenuis]
MLLSLARHLTAHASSVLQEPPDLQDPMGLLEARDLMANLDLLDLLVRMDNLDLKDHPETLEHQDLLALMGNLVLLEKMAPVDVGNLDRLDPLEHRVLQETLELMGSQDRMVLLDLRVLLVNLVHLDNQEAMGNQEPQEALDCQETTLHIVRAHLDRPFSCHDSHTRIAMLLCALQFIYDRHRIMAVIINFSQQVLCIIESEKPLLITVFVYKEGIFLFSKPRSFDHQYMKDIISKRLLGDGGCGSLYIPAEKTTQSLQLSRSQLFQQHCFRFQ